MDVVFQLAAAAFTVRRHKRVGLARRGVKTDLVSVVVAAAIASRLGTHRTHNNNNANNNNNGPGYHYT